MTVETFDVWLLGGALVVLVAALAVRIAGRLGLPGLLVYLAIGVGLGEAGFGVRFDDAQLAMLLAFAALVMILAEGGLTTRWSQVRGSMLLGLCLAIAGTLVTASLVAVAGHYVLGFDWRLAFLLGAVIAPTDAAAVFSVLRNLSLPPRLVGALEAESGLNDAPTVLLVTLLSSSAFSEQAPWKIVLTVSWELVAGAAFGLAVGWLGAKLLRRAALPSSGLYPLAVLGLAVAAYAGAGTLLHASGFAAVYLAGLVLGNAGLSHRRSILSFVEGAAWLAQIGLFVMLGLLAWPGRIGWDTVLAALVASIAVTFVARPVAVFLSCLPFRLSIRENVFLSWAGLRGAVPIVLMTIPLAAETPRAGLLFDVVFVLVVVLTVVQSPTLPWVARRLRVASTAESVADLDVEAGPLDLLDADLLEVRIRPGSRLAGVEIGELRLPAGVSVSLLVRGTRSIVPDDMTVLRVGDDLLVVAPRRVRESTERRLRAVSRHGRLAGWLPRRRR